LEAYGDGSFNWITGAPVNGLARIAKKHILPPDAVFESENGGVSLKIGVVDAVGAAAEEAELADEVEETNAEGKKEKKRRTRARVAINTERGGVLLEIVSDPLCISTDSRLRSRPRASWMWT
jgi:hypothetical protein